MNATLHLPRERLEALVPADVEAYLRVHGWQANAAASSAEMGVYHWPADPEAEVQVPRDKDFVDYALRLSEVVQALAGVEGRTAWEILETLSGRRADGFPNGPAGARGAGPPTAQGTPGEVA